MGYRVGKEKGIVKGAVWRRGKPRSQNMERKKAGWGGLQVEEQRKAEEEDL